MRALTKTEQSDPTTRRGPTIPNLRWYVCAMLFFATTVGYMDRFVLGFLKKPVFFDQLHWDDETYSWVVFGFTTAYALMMPIAGRIIDWLGVRIGYALSVLVWSLASMSHALAISPIQFFMARFALGVGEGGNFPAAIRSIADWFPKRERALATGIFNSGSNLGAIAVPLFIPFFITHFGWRSSFLVCGALDLLWIVIWLIIFRKPEEHPWLSTKERALIESDREPQPPKVPYRKLLRKRAAWAFLIGKFMTDPVWWFYLYWLPGFLNEKFNLGIRDGSPPLIAIYLAADVGSVGGGWLSSFLLKRGATVSRARKTAMFLCAAMVLPIGFVTLTMGNLWLTVTLVGMATAAHQGWSANLFTLVSDTFPKSAVGSVTGLGGMGGAIGGMLMAPAVGYWLKFSHGAYGPLFFIVASLYLFALLIIHLLLPKLEQAEI